MVPGEEIRYSKMSKKMRKKPFLIGIIFKKILAKKKEEKSCGRWTLHGTHK